MEPTMSPTNTPLMQVKRVLGEAPITEDLTGVTFSQYNNFTTGETVLVPRSKGGFVYGRVVKKTKFESCLLDTSIPHPSPQFRVEYPDKHSQQDLFKSLPPSMIGKIPDAEKNNSHTKVNGYRRELGGPATLRDLGTVVFSLANHFSVGEFVLVSRSNGGFTYGEISSPQSVNCSFAPKDSRHPVNGWRIFIDGNKSMKKELSAELIGKLTAVVHTNSEASISRPSDRPKNKYINKRRIDKEFNKISEELGESLPVTVAQTTEGPIKRMHSLSTSKHDTADDFSSYLPQSTTSHPSLAHSSISRARATLTSCNHNSADNLFAQQKLIFQEGEDDDDLEEEILIWNQPLSVSPPNADKSSDSPAPIEPQEAASPSKKGIIEIPSNVSLRSPKKIPYPNGNRNNRANRDGRKTHKNGENKCTVIIDAPNVAVKHGKGTFSSKGVVACVNYWRERGHKVIAFLPENYVNPTGNDLPKVDDIPAIQRLIDQQILISTPSQDYDDSYCIAYAKSTNGIIVTNDLYRDHIEKQEKNKRNEVRKWIKSHCVSFTFVIDEFLPNPDFTLP